jgi:hypothetical protein
VVIFVVKKPGNNPNGLYRLDIRRTNQMNPKKHILATLLAVAMTMHGADVGQPLALHPDNGHYLVFQGRPTVLIGSGEHYGAVMNLDFNYVRYLDTLAAQGLNHTRTFSGVYCEQATAFNIAANTLAPAPGRYLAPWARSDEPGYANGGNKFDLRKWDDAYFGRLKDFVAQAAKRGIVVELDLFCPFYEDAMWRLSEMNDTSATIRSGANGSASDASVRAFVRSMTVTRGSSRRRWSSCP